MDNERQMLRHGEAAQQRNVLMLRALGVAQVLAHQVLRGIGMAFYSVACESAERELTDVCVVEDVRFAWKLYQSRVRAMRQGENARSAMGMLACPRGTMYVSLSRVPDDCTWKGDVIQGASR